MKNLQTTIDHGAMPFIPFKSNTQPDRGSDLWSKMFFYYNYKREEFMAHHHKRSNVETVFQMIKAKFGEKLGHQTAQKAQMIKTLRITSTAKNSFVFVCLLWPSR